MKQPSPTTPTTLPIGTHSSTMPVHGQIGSGYDSEGPSESTEPSGPPSLPLEEVPVAKRVTGEVCLYIGDTSAGWTVGPQDPETVRRLALVYHDTVEGEGVGNTCIRLGQEAERLGYPQYRTLWRGISVLLPGLQEELSRPGNGPDTEYICCSVLRTTLLRLLDLGDVQHFVCVSETLRHAGLLSARVTDPLSCLAPSRLSEAYQSYWDLLHRLRLSQLACVLSSSCPVTCLAEASRKGVELKHSCSRCGREVVDVGAGSRLAVCEKCSDGGAVLCVLCHRPLGGLMVWCSGCGHGGHRACLHRWFSPTQRLRPTARGRYGKTIANHTVCKPYEQSFCPTGCGHRCTVSVNLMSK